jgi:hypothetical protein
MRIVLRVTLHFLAAAFICGCASHHNGPVYHAGDEDPPNFLVGPLAVVLTNLDGFSARVTCATISPDAPPTTTSGILLGREGRLVFQPTLPLKGKREQKEGGLFFIWDEASGSGYVVSEALQGYAPIRFGIDATAGPDISKPGIQESVNGHPCHRCDAEVPLNNGLKERFTLWEADDEEHLPVRIETVEAPSRMTLDLSDIRREFPAQEIFSPPDGFTPYASSVSLMNELIVRDSSLVKKHEFGEAPEGPAVRSGNWGGAATPAPQ